LPVALERELTRAVDVRAMFETGHDAADLAVFKAEPAVAHAHLIAALVLFRWDAPVFFANAELFEDRILAAVAASPAPVRCVVVTAEPATNVAGFFPFWQKSAFSQQPMRPWPSTDGPKLWKGRAVAIGFVG